MAEDETERKAAICKAQRSFGLEEYANAVCCVNIYGGRGDIWDGYDPRNLYAETYEHV